MPRTGTGTRGAVTMAKKILFIVSGATYWVMKDGTRYATGYWAEEFAMPYKIITDAGHEVVVGTPNGVTPNVDMMSCRLPPTHFTNGRAADSSNAGSCTGLRA